MTVTVVGRDQWGAAPAGRMARARPAAQLGVVIHYTSMDADEQADHARCAGRVRGIQRYHQGTRGWPDIGYTLVVCKHGGLFEGRGIGWVPAATSGHNSRWPAVCFLGDDTAGRDDVTDAGRRAIRAGVELIRGWAPGARRLAGHRDLGQTACPGAELHAWLHAGMPVGQAPPAPPPAPRSWYEMATREDLRAALREELDARQPELVVYRLGDDARQYVLVGGELVHIADPGERGELGRHFRLRDVHLAGPTLVQRTPRRAEPAVPRLVQEPGRPEVHLVEAGPDGALVRRHVTSHPRLVALQAETGLHVGAPRPGDLALPAGEPVR